MTSFLICTKYPRHHDTIHHQCSFVKKCNSDSPSLFHFLVQRPHTHIYSCKTLSTNNNPLQQPSIHNQINFHLENSSTQLACLSSNSLFWKKTTSHTNCSEWSNYTSVYSSYCKKYFLFLTESFPRRTISNRNDCPIMHLLIHFKENYIYFSIVA